ncbi:MAG: hypothetical protein U1E06_13155 [Tabrizicola sp.]|uniref:hypothetical protein n=1 Tax=Tabrizicola sp. TaxID=2005166 RepID=UPI002735825D|nr:hypothetical protein [Tabrizicola sp.]MDP3261440.1 hypothetical protein [Tabrizicola sp.]MDP3649229.1 hypothetical protein [Paracoccaceae bacterium]MDZ4067773.1 hypothetical protein [Tabrizicola sp.]
MQLQTELGEGTITTFAAGALVATAQVMLVAELDGRVGIITDRTSFHPQSLTWPDQPGDRGTVTLADGRQAVVDESREALLNRATGVIFTGDDAATVKRNDPDIHAVVLHLVQGSPKVSPGATVTLRVDEGYRHALSLQHTGVHLAALALNQIAAAFWAKEADAADSLGAPNLDKAAVTGSRIAPEGSVDSYRIGKSLRKKGFDRDAFLADLPGHTAAINAVLRQMLDTPAPVLVTPGEGYLQDRRLWTTHLNGTEVSMPCGGTHLADLSQIGGITVDLAATEDGFVMRTTTLAAS